MYKNEFWSLVRALFGYTGEAERGREAERKGGREGRKEGKRGKQAGQRRNDI